MRLVYRCHPPQPVNLCSPMMMDCWPINKWRCSGFVCLGSIGPIFVLSLFHSPRWVNLRVSLVNLKPIIKVLSRGARVSLRPLRRTASCLAPTCRDVVNPNSKWIMTGALAGKRQRERADRFGPPGWRKHNQLVNQSDFPARSRATFIIIILGVSEWVGHQDSLATIEPLPAALTLWTLIKIF